MDLKAEQIAKIKKKEFEDFCFDLVQAEAFERHRDPRFSAPSPADVRDGGLDILLTLIHPAPVPKLEYQQKYSLRPLTEDASLGAGEARQVEIAYSCKSGPNWLDLALDDLDPKHRQNTPRSVNVLLDGGYFKLFINTIANLKQEYKRNGAYRKPLQHLSHAFWERMKTIEPDAPDPSDRIDILDASTITTFLRGRGPAGGTLRWAERLGLLPLLRSVEEWHEVHTDQRGTQLKFEKDEERGARLADLREILASEASDPGERVVWLYGAPGVGKSRLAIQLLSDQELGNHARIALSHEEALSAIDEGRLFDRHPSALLVVDDCSEDDLDRLLSEFRRATRHNPSAHLLLLTPVARPKLGNVGKLHHAFLLGALDEKAIRSLIAESSGYEPDSQEVGTIALLSEGYPWFAKLLAEQLPEQNHAPRDIDEAVDWALASKWEAKKPTDLKRLRRKREQCLLLATVTQDVDWNQLDPDRKDALARAVDFTTWGELHQTAEECRDRGILRSALDWQFKYVTPLILEREIVRRMLGPGGPDRGGKRLAQAARPYLDGFFERIEQLGLPRDILDAIAHEVLKEAQDSRDWDTWQERALVGARLEFLARHLPAQAGRVLWQRIEQSPLDELQGRTGVRRDLVFALASLSERLHGFEDAEAALFRLALAENEPFGNNAREVWAKLFLAELNPTQRRLDERLNILERRLNAPEAAARHLALEGLRALLDWQAFRLGTENLDGPPLVPGPEEAHQGRVRGWELLAARLEDSDAQVAKAARTAAIKLLKSAVHTGVADEAGRLLAAHADRFDEREHVKLREALDKLRSYEALTSRADLGHGLVELANSVTARNFRQRLLERIGSWAPARSEAEAAAGDEALAQEALADGVPIRSHLDAVYSEDNVRAGAFVQALGRLDASGELYDDFERRALTPRGRWLLACYLAGCVEAGRGGLVERALDMLHRDEHNALTVAVILSMIKANDEQLGWVEADVLARRFDEQTLRMLRRRGWLEEVSDEALARFTRVLLDVGDAAHLTAALGHLVDRFRHGGRQQPSLLPHLERAFEALAGVDMDGGTYSDWKRAADILLAADLVARVAEFVCVALSGPRGPKAAWSVLHRCMVRNPIATWRAVASYLERDDERARKLVMAFRFHRASFIWPEEEVLAWVGGSERRACRVVWLVQPDEKALTPLLHAFVHHFGPDSRVADEIIARFHSTDGLVSSLAQRDAQRLERVRSWASHEEPAVRAFAGRLAESLKRSHERHLAYEEHEQDIRRRSAK